MGQRGASAGAGGGGGEAGPCLLGGGGVRLGEPDHQRDGTGSAVTPCAVTP